ncbi:hypothetical protein K474DRAFT_1644320 [Panus rudis PR-1116 ss-1]|nr:hypothetical protein K474DRAFT_1644320 [Panus rudis PR-1116 ss-1]
MSDLEADIAHVPHWLRTHPVLNKRGIVPRFRNRPYGCLYSARNDNGPSYAVKVIPRGSDEATIYRKLQETLASPANHTLPCEIVGSEAGEDLLLILPFLEESRMVPCQDWPLSRVLNFIYQVLEGLEFLHELNIAHLDLARGNIMISTPLYADFSPPLPLWRAYIIDFGNSRQLSQGPGRQLPIELPGSQYSKPLDIKSMDPYSWDMYCLAITCDGWFNTAYSRRPRPWITFWLSQWLLGEERGCVGVCRCRPTARRARQVVGLIYWFAWLWDRLRGVV